MRKKLGIDVRMISHSGIGIRIQHILSLWPFSESEIDLYLFGDPEMIRKYKIPDHSKIIPYHAKVYSLKEWLGHPQMSDMHLLDIPHFNVPIRFIQKSIVTIHDLIPYHFTEWHASLAKRIYLHTVLFFISRFAKKILTVSEFTKKDLNQTFPSSQEKSVVVYNGFAKGIFHRFPQKDLDTFQRKYKLPKQYLLTVGIAKGHKNMAFLFECLRRLWNSGKLTHPLVLGGLPKELPLDLLEFQKEFPDKVTFLPKVPFTELPLAYQGAEIFIFPSLWEGFGLPILEAQSMGVPVLSSNASVMPEILETSACYFDPKDPHAFEEVLMALISDLKTRKSLSQRGKRNAARFPWERGLSVYRQVLLELIQ